MRPLCSVVMASFQRRHLLERSLVCYQRQDFDNSRFELIVVDDHSTDGTRELVLDWSAATGIAATVMTTAPKPAAWRDCGAILNHGIRASAGEYVIPTHPEVMVGRRSVAACVDRLQSFEDARRGCVSEHYGVRNEDATGDLGPLRKKADAMAAALPIGCYAACKVYYLSPRETELLDTVGWRADPLNVRTLPGFYEEDQNGNLDYKHHVTDKVATPGFRIQTWDSWVFGGCSRETWKRLGGFWVTQRWGACDIGFNYRRKRLGMVEWTCPEDASIVIHANHDGGDNVPTPRVEQAWKDELRAMDLSRLAYPEVDELGW